MSKEKAARSGGRRATQRRRASGNRASDRDPVGGGHAVIVGIDLDEDGAGLRSSEGGRCGAGRIRCAEGGDLNTVLVEVDADSVDQERIDEAAELELVACDPRCGRCLTLPHLACASLSRHAGERSPLEKAYKGNRPS